MTYTDFEDAEFESMLLSVTRESLNMEHVGILTWSPVSSMSPEALAYFMPRFIELAVEGTVDRDGEPFFCQFINAFGRGSGNSERFKLFEPEHGIIMAETFDYVCRNYREQLEIEGWYEEALHAVQLWRGAHNGTVISN